MDAVGHLADHAQHPRVDGGHVDGRVDTVDGTWSPGGREQRHGVVLALDGQGPASAEGLEDLFDGQHVLAHAGPGRVEVRAVAAFDVGPHLSAQTQAEAAAAGLGQLPGVGRRDHGAAREGDGDTGEHVDVGRHGDGATGQIGGAPGLGDDETGESGGGGPTSEFTGLAERLSGQHGIELQGRGLARRHDSWTSRMRPMSSWTLGESSQGVRSTLEVAPGSRPSSRVCGLEATKRPSTRQTSVTSSA